MSKSNEFVYIKTENIIDNFRKIINSARLQAVKSVDFVRVQMYWNLGNRIFEEEQEKEYGSGFSVRQLEQSRQFYRVYPIANTLRSQLNWSQYRALIQISDPAKREYYELESVNNGWTERETERQIHSQLYERLLLSNDKEKLLTKEALQAELKKLSEAQQKFDNAIEGNKDE